MTQKNLMKTLYLVLLATLGTVWPWISANAQGTLNVTATLTGGISCTTTFTCNTGNCQFGCTAGPQCNSGTELQVTLQQLGCTKPSNTCISNVNVNGPNATYKPLQNTFGISATFTDNSCKCNLITLQGRSTTAFTTTPCTGSTVFPPNSSVKGPYTITNPGYTGTGN